MTFRKDSIMFIEHLGAFCIMVIICIALLPIDQLGVMPFFALCFVILAALTPVIHNELVTVNDEGIRCTQKGKVIWEYAWADIIKLKRSSRYRMPSVEIVINNHTNKVVPFEFSEHYFQLGRTARRAIALYYNSNL